MQSVTNCFDATFKVVPTIHYQLFILFVPFADFAFPVCYTLMSWKTESTAAGAAIRTNVCDCRL